MGDPFSDLRNLVTLFERRVQQIAKEHDVEHLSGPQGFVVMYLYKHSGEEVFIKDIEQRLKISKSVASNLINRMEKNSFIKVIPSQKDKRYKQLVLTSLGNQKAAKLANFHQVIHDKILADIDLTELKIAKKVIRKIRENLEIKEYSKRC
ncbi:MarR family winged helix-turn-helix transcriptional regulator [Streptococcus sciuri]|uniref:MarR family winged helix-turn-helix transcriptional regulator n=1 Tax=Streptococcus sciuri TaxID=2973939 RepID=A0ABT2F5X7_9STRE|nr:MarR family winged helix-turn-helix transcriptional regulator [Streptococcus sciuri]MCS4487790.1 MarR family winged helix-turn-helix transcriptional regulator [Streptococcus sciuri]